MTRRLPQSTAAAIVSIAAAACVHGSAQAASPVLADDSTPPQGSVGGVQNYVSGTLQLYVDANDVDSSLTEVRATLNGQLMASASLGDPSCGELSPGEATSESPLEADCPHKILDLPLALDTTSVPDGAYQLVVSVRDAAGNTTTLVAQQIVVSNHPARQSASVTIGVASPGESSHAPTPPGTGGALGYTSSTGGPTCQSPMLSMALATKPLRRNKKHVPVLRWMHRYVYKGRLTCLLAGHRVSAPTGTVVQVWNTIGRHTFKAGRGTMTVHRGQLMATLAYPSSRTISFHYQPSSGGVLQVKIPIVVVHPKTKAKPRR